MAGGADTTITTGLVSGPDAPREYDPHKRLYNRWTVFLRQASWLQAGRGYDADRFKETLEEKGIRPCIPGQKSYTTPVNYDRRKYQRRNRIEIMFGRLKNWKRIATRYNRGPTVCLAATVIF